MFRSIKLSRKVAYCTIILSQANPLFGSYANRVVERNLFTRPNSPEIRCSIWGGPRVLAQLRD